MAQEAEVGYAGSELVGQGRVIELGKLQQPDTTGEVNKMIYEWKYEWNTAWLTVVLTKITRRDNSFNSDSATKAGCSCSEYLNKGILSLLLFLRR